MRISTESVADSWGRQVICVWRKELKSGRQPQGPKWGWKSSLIVTLWCWALHTALCKYFSLQIPSDSHEPLSKTHGFLPLSWKSGVKARNRARKHILNREAFLLWRVESLCVGSAQWNERHMRGVFYTHSLTHTDTHTQACQDAGKTTVSLVIPRSVPLPGSQIHT